MNLDILNIKEQYAESHLSVLNYLILQYIIDALVYDITLHLITGCHSAKNYSASKPIWSLQASVTC